MPAVDIYPAHAVLGGLTLSAVEDGYVEWIIKEVTGWESSASTGESVQKPRSNGAWAGDAFLTAKSITMSGRMYARDPQVAQDAANRLIAANGLADTPLSVTQWGITRWTMVRRQDEPIITWIGWASFDWSIQMEALDPRRFGVPLSLSLTLPEQVNGLTIPFMIPFTIPSYRNTTTLTNDGITAGPVTMRINGPVVNPIITHTGASGTQVFAMRITLGPDEWLDIDMDAHTVMAQGTASRNGYITQRGWFKFDVGLNTFAYAAEHYSTSLLNITATPAF